MQLSKEQSQRFNLKSKKDWVKRAVEAQKANHPQAVAKVAEAEEAVDPALMKSLFLMPQTLMPWS
jgi:hypothetical protein